MAVGWERGRDGGEGGRGKGTGRGTPRRGRKTERGTGAQEGGVGTGEGKTGAAVGVGAVAAPAKEKRARAPRCPASRKDQDRVHSTRSRVRDENGEGGGGESCDDRGDGGGGVDAVPLEAPMSLKIGEREASMLGSGSAEMAPESKAEPEPAPCGGVEVGVAGVAGMAEREGRGEVGSLIPKSTASTATATAAAKTKTVGVRASKRLRQDYGLIPEAVIAMVICGGRGRGREGG